MNNTTVTIVGAGISGLHTAYELAKLGTKVRVLEASNRVGGRIFSPSRLGSPQSAYDLGPSWFWPGQSNIENLVSELGLTEHVFTQYAVGDALYEPIGQEMQRGVQGISMQGSYRMAGGLSTIITSLTDYIVRQQAKDSIQLNSKVSEISKLGNDHLLIHYGDGKSVRSDKVVIAMPPRVAIDNIVFSPALSKERTEEFVNVATWMAGHAKAVIVYKEAFWREANLSGDVFSQRGPLSEIHDASFPNDDKFALFGFFATPPKHRETDHDKIFEKVVDQLVGIFGKPASHPVQMLYKNWAADPLVATARDQSIPNHHPMNCVSSIVEPDWQNRLLWSGTETASGHYNGYIEGAIMASQSALQKILMTRQL